MVATRRLRPLPIGFTTTNDARLAQAVHLLPDLGVRQLRTGISWADLHRPGGRDWYDRMFAALAGVEGLSLLVSLWHTPPSISANGRTNGPPMRDGRSTPPVLGGDLGGLRPLGTAFR